MPEHDTIRLRRRRRRRARTPQSDCSFQVLHSGHIHPRGLLPTSAPRPHPCLCVIKHHHFFLSVPSIRPSPIVVALGSPPACHLIHSVPRCPLSVISYTQRSSRDRYLVYCINQHFVLAPRFQFSTQASSTARHRTGLMGGGGAAEGHLKLSTGSCLSCIRRLCGTGRC